MFQQMDRIFFFFFFLEGETEMDKKKKKIGQVFVVFWTYFIDVQFVEFFLFFLGILII